MASSRPPGRDAIGACRDVHGKKAADPIRIDVRRFARGDLIGQGSRHDLNRATKSRRVWSPTSVRLIALSTPHAL
jgi:hypothetical protein